MTSGKPDQPDPVTVHITNLDVVISWEEPTYNFAQITAYRVKLVQSDGVTFTEESTYCDASQQLILLQKFCLIPHSVLTAEPYSLTFDTLIEAKLEAFNRNGWSPESTVNTASGLLKDRIQTVPSQMVASLIEGALTNTQQVHLEWQELVGYVETGGADITSYNIQWDMG